MFHDDLGEIKPCPFCGADNGNDIQHLESNKFYWVECRKCGGSTESTGESKSEAVKIWNNRPTEEALNKKLEASFMDGIFWFVWFLVDFHDDPTTAADALRELNSTDYDCSRFNGETEHDALLKLNEGENLSLKGL